MPEKFTSYLSVALICLSANSAGADDFEKRCKELSQRVKVSVTFQDRSVVVDQFRNIEALNGLSGKRLGSHHNVYGLTHAEPYFRLNVVPRAFADGHGQICAIPDISLSLGFTEMVVYLARELTDQCRRDVIWQHEEEHVKTWKAHLRASAQLLTTILRRDLGEPRIYFSRDATEAGVRLWANELVVPWVKRVLATVAEAQQAIDTPASYSAVLSRLRTCPGTAH